MMKGLLCLFLRSFPAAFPGRRQPDAESVNTNTNDPQVLSLKPASLCDPLIERKQYQQQPGNPSIYSKRLMTDEASRIWGVSALEENVLPLNPYDVSLSSRKRKPGLKKRLKFKKRRPKRFKGLPFSWDEAVVMVCKRRVRSGLSILPAEWIQRARDELLGFMKGSACASSSSSSFVEAEMLEIAAACDSVMDVPWASARLLQSWGEDTHRTLLEELLSDATAADEGFLSMGGDRDAPGVALPVRLMAALDYCMVGDRVKYRGQYAWELLESVDFSWEKRKPKYSGGPKNLKMDDRDLNLLDISEPWALVLSDSESVSVSDAPSRGGGRGGLDFSFFPQRSTGIRKKGAGKYREGRAGGGNLFPSSSFLDFSVPWSESIFAEGLESGLGAGGVPAFLLFEEETDDAGAVTASGPFFIEEMWGEVGEAHPEEIFRVAPPHGTTLLRDRFGKGSKYFSSPDGKPGRPIQPPAVRVPAALSLSYPSLNTTTEEIRPSMSAGLGREDQIYLLQQKNPNPMPPTRAEEAKQEKGSGGQLSLQVAFPELFESKFDPPATQTPNRAEAKATAEKIDLPPAPAKSLPVIPEGSVLDRLQEDARPAARNVSVAVESEALARNAEVGAEAGASVENEEGRSDEIEEKDLDLAGGDRESEEAERERERERVQSEVRERKRRFRERHQLVSSSSFSATHSEAPRSYRYPPSLPPRLPFSVRELPSPLGSSVLRLDEGPRHCSFCHPPVTSVSPSSPSVQPSSSSFSSIQETNLSLAPSLTPSDWWSRVSPPPVDEREAPFPRADSFRSGGKRKNKRRTQSSRKERSKKGDSRKSAAEAQERNRKSEGNAVPLPAAAAAAKKKKEKETEKSEEEEEKIKREGEAREMEKEKQAEPLEPSPLKADSMPALLPSPLAVASLSPSLAFSISGGNEGGLPFGLFRPPAASSLSLSPPSASPPPPTQKTEKEAEDEEKEKSTRHAKRSSNRSRRGRRSQKGKRKEKEGKEENNTKKQQEQKKKGRSQDEKSIRENEKEETADPPLSLPVSPLPPNISLDSHLDSVSVFSSEDPDFLYLQELQKLRNPCPSLEQISRRTKMAIEWSSLLPPAACASTSAPSAFAPAQAPRKLSADDKQTKSASSSDEGAGLDAAATAVEAEGASSPFPTSSAFSSVRVPNPEKESEGDGVAASVPLLLSQPVSVSSLPWTRDRAKAEEISTLLLIREAQRGLHVEAQLEELERRLGRPPLLSEFFAATGLTSLEGIEQEKQRGARARLLLLYNHLGNIQGFAFKGLRIQKGDRLGKAKVMESGEETEMMLLLASHFLKALRRFDPRGSKSFISVMRGVLHGASIKATSMSSANMASAPSDEEVSALSKARAAWGRMSRLVERSREALDALRRGALGGESAEPADPQASEEEEGAGAGGDVSSSAPSTSEKREKGERESGLTRSHSGESWGPESRRVVSGRALLRSVSDAVDAPLDEVERMLLENRRGGTHDPHSVGKSSRGLVMRFEDSVLDDSVHTDSFLSRHEQETGHGGKGGMKFTGRLLTGGRARRGGGSSVRMKVTKDGATSLSLSSSLRSRSRAPSLSPHTTQQPRFTSSFVLEDPKGKRHSDDSLGEGSILPHGWVDRDRDIETNRAAARGKSGVVSGGQGGSSSSWERERDFAVLDRAIEALLPENVKPIFRHRYGLSSDRRPKSLRTISKIVCLCREGTRLRFNEGAAVLSGIEAPFPVSSGRVDPQSEVGIALSELQAHVAGIFEVTIRTHFHNKRLNQCEPWQAEVASRRAALDARASSDRVDLLAGSRTCGNFFNKHSAPHRSRRSLPRAAAADHEASTQPAVLDTQAGTEHKIRSWMRERLRAEDEDRERERGHGGMGGFCSRKTRRPGGGFIRRDSQSEGKGEEDTGRKRQYGRQPDRFARRSYVPGQRKLALWARENQTRHVWAENPGMRGSAKSRGGGGAQIRSRATKKVKKKKKEREIEEIPEVLQRALSLS